MAELLVQLVHSVNGIVSSLKLAVGYLLDELKNDITRETPASFEPSIDYVVTNPESFRGALRLREISPGRSDPDDSNEIRR